MKYYALKDPLGFPVPGTMIPSATSLGNRYVELTERINPTVDPCFNIGTGMNHPGDISKFVRCVVAEPDGGVTVGGLFRGVSGFNSNDVMRFKADGTPDATFVSLAGVQALDVRKIVKHSTGYYLITTSRLATYGAVTVWGGVIKITNTGALFPGWVGEDNTGIGRSAPATAVIELADGRVLMGVTVGGGANTPALRVCNADGTVETDTLMTLTSVCTGFEKQASGKILCYGYFGVFRLNTDLSIDTTFNNNQTRFNGRVSALTILKDGSIACAGSFTTYNGQPALGMAILNSEGFLDPTFQIDYQIPQPPLAIVPNKYNELIVFAIGTEYRLTPVNHIIKFARTGRWIKGYKPAVITGAVDSYFNPSGNWALDGAVAVKNDKIVVVGSFNYVENAFQMRITRLDADGQLDKCTDKKIVKRHPQGLRFFTKVSNSGDMIGNTLIAAKNPPSFAYREYQVIVS